MGTEPSRTQTNQAPRCFGGDDPLYSAYHDSEWGVPVHGDKEIFERISLEIFASGLSWLTVLRKREAFRSAFARFDPRVVAAFGQADVERLMADSAIIRNRAKIEATIDNAKALVAFQESGGSLDELVWSHRPADHPVPPVPEAIPKSIAESDELMGRLKAIGLRRVGPVTVYSTLQAIGVVNDHPRTCPRSRQPGGAAGGTSSAGGA